MAGKTLDIENILVPDQLGTRIANEYVNWETRRGPKLSEWEETLRYVFATDTTQTTNSKLPWSNKTTLPKLCQVRDNLHANYMAALFPTRKWITWLPGTYEDADISKAESIESYMDWVVDRNEYYETISQLVLDYIDYGNSFATVEWQDDTMLTVDQEFTGYVGPRVRRISPLDIVFNPAAPTFADSPKIVRSYVAMGEVKRILDQTTATEEDRETAEALFSYLNEIRLHVSAHTGSTKTRDAIYNIQGYDSFSNYLQSGLVEVLTFYGDIYDQDTKELKRNVVIKVVDRHKVIYEAPNNSAFGKAPIFHVGWRLRPDNLWAAGPLDNLVGMQYRIDHLENCKADMFDLNLMPPQKVRGYVEEYTWGPLERIYVGDDGDVELMPPNPVALQADTEIAILMQQMEELSGSPREAMGIRTPGEKTRYEVQSLENAAGRIFQNKTNYFERNLVENLLNAMLELARRNMTLAVVPVFDQDLKIIADFQQLTPRDITGVGRIKPIAARHFAEKANLTQNLTNMFNSPVGNIIMPHVSSVKLAQLFEDLIDVKEYRIFEPYVALTEQAEQQSLANAHEENVAIETATPSNFLPGDADLGPLDDETN